MRLRKNPSTRIKSNLVGFIFQKHIRRVDRGKKSLFSLPSRHLNILRITIKYQASQDNFDEGQVHIKLKYMLT